MEPTMTISYEQFKQNVKNDATSGEAWELFGWYDWFCKVESLPRRAKQMAPKIDVAVEWLKKHFTENGFEVLDLKLQLLNRCPLNGSLYDQATFWVQTKDSSGNVQHSGFAFVPSSGHICDAGTKDMSTLHGIEGPCADVALGAYSWSELKKMLRS
jgi:hypothetical protein